MSLPTSATKVRRHGSAIRRSGWRRAIRDLLVVVLLTVGGIAGYFWWDEWPIREIEAALRRRDYSQALNLSNSFVRDHPDSVAAVELKARALTGMQRWSEASRLFERVGARTPAGERAWSLALLHQERWSDALPLLSDLHRLDPRDAEVLHELTASQAKLGNVDEAISLAEKLAALPGYEARGQLMLGTLHARRQNHKRAIQAWRQVLNYDPEATHLQLPADEFFLSFGRTCLNNGQPSEAIPLLEKSLSIRVTPLAQAFLGEAFEQTGHVEQAVELWKQAVAEDLKQTNAREGLARLALQNKQADEALDWLVPLLDLPELRTSTAYLAQRAYAQRGDAAKAAEWHERTTELRRREQRLNLIETGLQRAPQSFWSRAVVAHQFASEGNLAQAARIVAVLRKEAPNEPFIQQLVHALETGAPLPSLDQLPMKQF